MVNPAVRVFFYLSAIISFLQNVFIYKISINDYTTPDFSKVTKRSYDKKRNHLHNYLIVFYIQKNYCDLL